MHTWELIYGGSTDLDRSSAHTKLFKTATGFEPITMIDLEARGAFERDEHLLSLEVFHIQPDGSKKFVRDIERAPANA